MKNGVFCDLPRVAFGRTDVLEEIVAPIIRVTRIGELGTTLALTKNVVQFLVTGNVPSSPNLVTLMMEAIRFSETSVFTGTSRRNIFSNQLRILYRDNRPEIPSGACVETAASGQPWRVQDTRRAVSPLPAGSLPCGSLRCAQYSFIATTAHEGMLSAAWPRPGGPQTLSDLQKWFLLQIIIEERKILNWPSWPWAFLYLLKRTSLCQPEGNNH
jgi:hypothetical protein